MDLSPKQFSDIITLTRTGTATRVNASGLIETVAANLPRFDYDPVTLTLRGLLVEDGRTNLALQSAAFDNASWTKTGVTVTADAGTSPDGNASADKIIANNAVALASASVSQNIAKAASAQAMTYSVFCKAVEFNRALVSIIDAANSANNASATISLVNGSVVAAAAAAGTFTGASVNVSSFGNGWYRIALTFTSGTETSIQPRVAALDSVATTGNGTSGILAWGAQLEAGACPTSYIPTTTASVVRGNEQPIISGANFSQVYNQSEGTIFAVVRPAFLDVARVPRLFEVSDGTGANRVLVFSDSSRTIFGRTDSASVTRSNLTVANKFNNGVRVKVAYGFKQLDTALSVDGGLVTDTANSIIPSALSELNIAHSRFAATASLNGWIEQLRYFPNKLPNATLQALTA